MNKKITWVASNARRWAKLGRLSILNKPEVAVKRFQAAAAGGGSHKTESHSNFQVALVSGFMGKTLSANKKSNKQPTTNNQQEQDKHTQWHHGDALSTRASGKCRILEPGVPGPVPVPAQLLMATVVRHHVRTAAGPNVAERWDT